MIRRLAVLALLICTIVSAGFMVPIPAANASAVVEVTYVLERYYYSDSTYTGPEVGMFIRYCSGQTYSWGQQTPYYRDYKEPCGGSESWTPR